MLDITDQTKVIDYILSRNGRVYGTNKPAYRGFPTRIRGLLSRQLAILTTNSSLYNLRTRCSIYGYKLFLLNIRLVTNPLWGLYGWTYERLVKKLTYSEGRPYFIITKGGYLIGLISNSYNLRRTRKSSESNQSLSTKLLGQRQSLV